MPIRRKRRLLMLGGTVCLGELAIGGYLYAQSLGNRQSFRTHLRGDCRRRALKLGSLLVGFALSMQQHLGPSKDQARSGPAEATTVIGVFRSGI